MYWYFNINLNIFNNIFYNIKKINIIKNLKILKIFYKNLKK